MFRRNPFDDFFDAFFKEMRDMFRDFEGINYDKFDRWSDLKDYKQPNVDVWEDDDNVYVSIELPGVDKKDIDLRVDETEIELKVDTTQESKEEKEGFKGFRKVAYQFYRRIPLPTEIKPDQAKATYKNGVLEIVAPKARPGKGKKRINIE